MAKNIAVIDEQGNRYEATYPKRAKGLVKSGRARFVDEKTICLARPPDKPEDKKMSENMGSNHLNSENLSDLEGLGGELEKFRDMQKGVNAAVEDLMKITAPYLEAAEKGDSGTQQKTGESRNGQPQAKPLRREIVEQVLEQLNHFAADDAYITALAKEDSMDSECFEKIVTLRETTRQKHLEVYKSVLEQALANESSRQVNVMDQLASLTDWISGLDRDDFDKEMWEMIRTKAFELMNRITAVI